MDAQVHKDEAINKSYGGNLTKIDLVVDSYELANRFILTGSAAHESKVALGFIRHLPSSGYIIADNGYDNDVLRDTIRSKKCALLLPVERIQN